MSEFQDAVQHPEHDDGRDDVDQRHVGAPRGFGLGVEHGGVRQQDGVDDVDDAVNAADVVR